MMPKLILTVIVGFNLCGLSWAAEDKEKEAVYLNATAPHEVAQEEWLPQSGQTKTLSKNVQGKATKSLSAMPQPTANPLSVKITYKGRNLDAWQLYDPKEHLAAQIKYK